MMMITIEDALIDTSSVEPPDWIVARQELKQRFEGGLAAEQQTYDRLTAELEHQHRQFYLLNRGRVIDLKSLLALRDADRRPIWTVANPRKNLSNLNGGIGTDGTVWFKNHKHITCKIRTKTPCSEELIPIGMPLLPERIREIVTDEGILEDALWLGILFQPEEWAEVQPDPAVVVRWKDMLPGVYHCLAIWGHDGPRIEEFIS